MTDAVARFRELLQIPTVSLVDEDLIDWESFDRFAEALQRLYPKTHEVLQKSIVDDHALLFHWQGRESAEPLVLMAHMDVVPVVEQEWEHPPFGAVLVGEGADATIHARGAIDDKGSLVAIFEAVERLVAEGFVPENDVYLAFGHNEETAGAGAQSMAQELKNRGVRPSMVLDEGGAVVDDVIPGISVPTAMVGVAERGIATINLAVREAGGHASTPPPVPATVRLARAIDALSRKPFPARISPPVRAMLSTLAPWAPPALKAVFSNLSVTAPVVAQILSAQSQETNASVRTTAVVTELSGAPADNVLATTARASVNVRILTGETIASVTERVRRVIGDDAVEISVRHGSEPSPVSAWKGPAWQRIARAVGAIGADIVTTPYLQSGATDSRFFTGISENVYRFAPFHMSRSERDALHSHNERIRVDSWTRGIDFYRALLADS